jgi:hypothetical protein
MRAAALVPTGITAVAVAGIGAMAITSANPVPEVYQKAAEKLEVSLAAVPTGGDILERGLLNQVENFKLQLPFIKLGVVDANAAASQLPLTFIAALASGNSPLQSVGIAGYSTSSIVSEAWTGLVVSDAYQIVPRTQNSLGWAVLSGIRIAEAFPFGNVSGAIAAGNTNVFAAVSLGLLSPVPSNCDANTTPCSANPAANTLPASNTLTLPEVLGVETVNVLSATILQSSSLALLGYIDAPNQFFLVLANGGSLLDATLVSNARFHKGFSDAADNIGAAVETAITNIKAAADRTDLAGGGLTTFGTTSPSTAKAASKKTFLPEDGLPQGPDAFKALGSGPVADPTDADKPLVTNTSVKDITAPTTGTKAPTNPLVRPSFKAVVGATGPGATTGGSAAATTPSFQPGKHAADALGNVGVAVKDIADKVTKSLGGPAAKPAA